MQALWKNRHQVWQRLEENGQISMKVVPSQIELTLPSPKLGTEVVPVVDPAWEPRIKTKINNTIHERGQVTAQRTDQLILRDGLFYYGWSARRAQISIHLAGNLAHFPPLLKRSFARELAGPWLHSSAFCSA